MRDCCLTTGEQYFQLYNGENDLRFVNMMMVSVLDHNAKLRCNKATSLKPQSESRHDVPSRMIIMTLLRFNQSEHYCTTYIVNRS